MKILFITIGFTLICQLQLFGQENNSLCKGILYAGESAFEHDSLAKAQLLLQDAETCDYKRLLRRERQALQERIFQRMEKQKQDQRANFLTAEAHKIEKQDPTVALRLLKEAISINGDNVTLRDFNEIYDKNNFYSVIIYDTAVQGFSFAPDGKSFLTISGEGEIKRMDMNHQPLLSFKDSTFDYLNSASNKILFSPDGKNIVAATCGQRLAGNIIKVWDMAGHLDKAIPIDTGYVINLSFSPDTKLLLAQVYRIGKNKRNSLKVIDIGTGRIIREVNVIDEWVSACSFTKNSDSIIVFSTTGTTVFDIAGRGMRKLDFGWASRAEFSSNKQYILTADTNGRLKLWKSDGKLVHTFRIDGMITTATFSGSGNKILIATGDPDGENGYNLSLWSSKGTMLEEFRGHSGYISNAILSSDEKTIFSASADHTVRLWHLKPKKYRNVDSVNSDTKFGFASQRTYFAGIGKYNDKTYLNVWDIYGSNIIKDISVKDSTLSKELISNVSVAPDGSKILLSDDGFRPHVIMINAKGRKIKDYDSFNIIGPASFSVDGKTVFLPTYDGIIEDWVSPDSGKENLKNLLFHNNLLIDHYQISPDKKYIFTSDLFDNALMSKDGRIISHMDPRYSQLTASFSSDSKYILVSNGASSFDYDTYTALWTTEGRCIRTLNAGRVMSLAFSPAGNIFAVGTSKSVIRIFDTDGDLLQEFKSSNGSISALCFTPDGKELVSISKKGIIRSWPITDCDKVDQILNADNIAPLTPELRKLYKIEGNY